MFDSIKCNHHARILFFFLRHQDAKIDLAPLVRNCQKIKRGILPKNPENIDAINAAFAEHEIDQVFGHTADKNQPEKFFDFAVKKETHSFCVFSSKKIIRLVLEHVPVPDRHILMDATFKIVPIGEFSQLLILYFRIKYEVCFVIIFI